MIKNSTIRGLRASDGAPRFVASLGDSEAQLQAILMHSQSAMFIKDSDGRYLRVNERFMREFGLPRDMFLGRTDFQIFPADFAKALQSNDELVLTQGWTVEFKQKRMGKQGSRTSLVFKFPVRDSFSRIVGIGGTITDITDQPIAAQSADTGSAGETSAD
jgi:two-component system sensor histidine kinase/response regulator